MCQHPEGSGLPSGFQGLAIVLARDDRQGCPGLLRPASGSASFTAVWRWVAAIALTAAGCATLEPGQIQAAGRAGQRLKLEAWLKDDQRWVREEAALAMASIQAPEAAVALEGVLSDGAESSWVRAAAARSLGAIGDRERGLPLLLGIASAPGAEPELKLAAIEASCRLGGAEAVSGLAPLVRDDDLLVSAYAERMVRDRCGR